MRTVIFINLLSFLSTAYHNDIDCTQFIPRVFPLKKTNKQTNEKDITGLPTGVSSSPDTTVTESGVNGSKL